jgi:hypothetical protein
MARLIVRQMRAWFPAALIAVVLASGLAGTAQAYVGPGAGLTAIGSVLALFAAIGLAIVGFVWYPVKRMLKRKPADGVTDVKKEASARGPQ